MIADPTATPRPTVAARIRSLLFWMHLALGASAGAIILLMSVTGVMLGYERQMIGWIDGVPRVPAHAEAARLDLDALVASAGLEREAIASIVVKRSAVEPVTVRFRDRAVPAAALDPTTAAVIPTPQGGKGQAFFSGLRRWHRWMGASAAEARARARTVTGAANLAFLVLVLSGIWLWWPRRWSVASLRATTLFQAGLRGKARDFNWHHTVGFWCAIPLALVVATGVFISYQWPGRLLDRALGSSAERAAARVPVRPAATTPAGTAVNTPVRSGGSTPADAPVVAAVAGSLMPASAALDGLLAAGRRARDDWGSITITLAAPKDSVHTVLVAGGNTYRPDLRTTLLLDAQTGATREARDFAALSMSRKIRAWVRFGHTGEVFGIVGQTIATIVTGAGVVLVWTGIALSLRRLASWRRRRRRLVARPTGVA